MVPVATIHARRGVLLLVVLSVLTLFLMLGAAYVAVASRARKASRAFADNVVAGTAGGMAQERLLDDAFLTVARGTLSNKTLPVGTSADVDYFGKGVNGGDDLLGDKYGSQTVTGRVTAAANVSGSPALLQLTCSATGNAPSDVSEYAGRVATLALPGLSVSTRIVGATGVPASPTLYLAGGATVTGEQLSAARITAAIAKVSSPTVTTLIINGREFDDSGKNESYDAYDADNPLLTRSGSVSLTGTAAIYGGAPLTVDNDADGIADSAFLDIGLPPVLGANGQIVYPQAAILVLDLDGRLNVNAHGSATDVATIGSYPALNASTTLSSTMVPQYQLPRGYASGPADVSLSRSLVFSTSGSTENQIVQDATYALAGTTPAGNDKVATNREVPKIGAVEGRFGDSITTGSMAAVTGNVAGTGRPNHNDPVSHAADRWRVTLSSANTATPFSQDPGRFGTPWDMKGQMRIWADEFGQPVFFKPTWGGDDAKDDPYEVNLTRLGSRTGYTAAPNGTVPADNLYTPAELEGLLRYFDPDSLKLPRRLVAISGSNAASNRLRLTTESWDTPAITGKAWRDVIGSPFKTLLSASGLSAPNRGFDSFSPETIMGHKFDINRPFHDTQYDEPNDATGTARRQAFARHLYCLMMSIARANGVTMNADLARQIAQYAVNVVDYRDGDSVMTRFDFDPQFSPSKTTWNPGADDYVWGCERPELLITETLAWHDRRTDDLGVGNQVVDTSNADDDFDQDRRPYGAFFVELYSPWAARRAQPAGSGTTAVLLSGSGTRADPLPATLRQSGTFGNDIANGPNIPDSTISLHKTVSGFPVWRLASVRGSVQGGTGINTTTKNIVDPSAPGSIAVVDRVFYFGDLTGPGTALRNPANPRDGLPGGVFWATGTATVEPSQSQYVVVGTDGLGFDYRYGPFEGTADRTPPPVPNGLSYERTVHLRFDGPSMLTGTRQPATLSEPISTQAVTSASVDPYELVTAFEDGGNQNKFTPDDSSRPNLYSPNTKLQRSLDKPIDRVSGVPNISQPFLTAGNGLPAGYPLLMFNGTHENFAVLHLQRLADPGKPWHVTTNPYITVDSMPVDLTVVNTNASGANHDEPGKTPVTPGTTDPSPAALSWLQTQKTYRYQSVERGGKLPSPPPAQPERDIWSRRVTLSGTQIVTGTTPITGLSPYLAESSPPATRTAIDLSPLVGANPTKAILQPVAAAQTTLTGTTDHTLREWSNQTELDSRPARFEKTAGKPPLFPWLAWPNQPFGSVIDLALVPVASPFELPALHSTAAPGAPSPTWFHLPRFFESTKPESPWDALAGRTANPAATLFDFVHVPSPFAAVYTTVASSTTTVTGSNALSALATVGLDVFPLNQISNFREPGRVNVNTIPDGRVWRALFGAMNVKGVSPTDADTPDDPFLNPLEADARDQIPGWSATMFAPAASGGSQSLSANLRNGADDNQSSGAGRATSQIDFFTKLPARGAKTRPATLAPANALDRFVSEPDTDNDGVLDPNEDTNSNGVRDFNDYRNTDRNAYFRYQTMRQLSGVTTTRSHVFGVWITLRYVDSSGKEVEPISRNRAFYIFDRSIPVAYERGHDHNVRDAILLRRVIQ